MVVTVAVVLTKQGPQPLPSPFSKDNKNNKRDSTVTWQKLDNMDVE